MNTHVAKDSAALNRVANERIRANLPREHGYEPVARIEGVLPEDLSATLYRNGPALSERFGRTLGHAFEGDGALTAIRLKGGAASFASRLVRTAEFLEEEAQGRLLYGSRAGWARRVMNGLRGRSKTPANVNVMHWQGQLYAMPEGAPPYRVNPETLETLERLDAQDIQGGYHSAHPHRVEAREASFSFRILWGKQNELSVFAYPDRGSPRELVRVPLDSVAYLHDFITTPEHLIFVIPPVRIDLLRAISRLGSLEDLFRWKPEEGTRVLVVPIDDPEAYVWFDTGAFFVWHFANAFMEQRRLHVDFVHWPDFGSFDAIGDADTDPTSAPSLRRLSLDLDHKSAALSMLSDMPCEFPSVQASASGKRSESIWSQVERGGRSGVARHDLMTNNTALFWFDPGQLASEPNLLPSQKGEDATLISTLVYDVEAHTSFLAIFDAFHIEDGPITRIWLTHHIPMTFHGHWA